MNLTERLTDQWNHLREQLKELAAPVITWFLGLSLRERKLVAITSGAASLFLLFLLLMSFAGSARAHTRRTAEKMAKLREAETLATSYREAEAKRAEAEAKLRNSDIKLISYIEEKGSAAGLEISSMNPKGDVPVGDGTILESAVELTLTDVKLNRLTDFLGSVERSPGVVRVKYLRLEPRPQTETVTAWTTIAAYRLKEEQR